MVIGKFTKFDEMPFELEQKFKHALESVGFELGISASNRYFILYDKEVHEDEKFRVQNDEEDE